MPVCRRCGEKWYEATWLDPAEPCDCHENDGRDDLPDGPETYDDIIDTGLPFDPFEETR